MKLNEEFWTQKYESHKTGWDLGQISPPLKTYFDQLTNKEIKILIPGAGNAYEAEYLFNKGFKNIYVVDISKNPLKNIKNRIPSFPEKQLIHSDFFNLKNTFDLVIEQTFFCAINPDLRKNYAKKMHSILNENGKLVGLLFNAQLNDDHPPFGGTKKEYLNYFNPYFSIDIFEECYNSFHNRKAIELFVKFKKKA